MDINTDVEIDSLLIQQFSSMATQDRDVLVAEFQKLLGDQLNAEGCAFFLDMNNWNLQAAVCSYFEYYQQDTQAIVVLPKMSLVCNADTHEPQTVSPNTNVTKTWRLINSGSQAWPPGCCLRFVRGAQLTAHDRVVLESSLEPASSIDVTLELTSPAQSGSYTGEWRMSTISGNFFGESLPVNINVSDRIDTTFNFLRGFEQLTVRPQMTLPMPTTTIYCQDEMAPDSQFCGQRQYKSSEIGYQMQTPCSSGTPQLNAAHFVSQPSGNGQSTENTDVDSMETSS